MTNSNSRFLTRTTLAVLACSGLAFGCVNNGDRDDAARDQGSSTTAPDTYSGTTTGAGDTTSGMSDTSATTSGATTAAPATGAATTNTTTAAPATGAATTNTTTGASTTGTTAPAAGTTGTTDTTATTGSTAGTAATTPEADTKMASAKKKTKKQMKKSDKPAADAPKTDSSSINSGAGDLGMHEDENLNDEAGTEVTDPSLASTTNPDEESTNDIAMDEESTDEAAIGDDDSTVSGATSSPESSTATTAPTTSGASAGTESVSTSSASDEDLKSAARMAGGLSPWYTEPYSRIPTQVFRPTGIDKSVAALESYNEFIDPAALQRAIRSRDALRPVTEIDFNSYGYDNRARFTSQMNSRLANIDSRLDMIEAKAPEAKNQISTIHGDHMALETQLEDVREVDESQWTSFRDSFRDRLTALEREVARLSVSR